MFLSDLIFSLFGVLLTAILGSLLCVAMASAVYVTGHAFIAYSTIVLGVFFVVGCVAFCVMEVQDYKLLKGAL